MLKVLVVDDEERIRTGLKTLIDWPNHGFELSGEAGNGQEGLEMVRALTPDLVVTDIKMPGMDGLEMIESIKKEGIETKFIILSGYPEFDYARKALALGAEDYILKPIDEAQLADKVTEIYSEIIESRNKEALIKEGKEISREKYLEKLVHGQIPNPDEQQIYSEYDMNFPWDGYCVVLIEMEQHAVKQNIVHLRNRVEDYLNRHLFGYSFRTERYIGIVARVSSRFDRWKERIWGDFSQSIRENSEDRIVISIGSPVKTLFELQHSFAAAKRLLSNKFVYGRSGIISWEMENKEMPAIDKDLWNVSELGSAIDANNLERIIQLLEKIKASSLAREFHEQDFKRRYAFLYISLIQRLSRSNQISIEEALISEDVLSAIYATQSLVDLHEYFQKTLTNLSQLLARLRPDSVILKLIDYIDRNYSQNLKIETLAQTFGYNNAYLGKLIKSHTRFHFNQYLNTVRLENAKKLLTEGMKVYEVAESVGYCNMRYFQSKFKQHFGVSPASFKTGRDR